MCTQKFKKIEAEIISRNEQIMSKSVVLILLSTVTKNTFTVSGFFLFILNFFLSTLVLHTPDGARTHRPSSVNSKL